MADAQVFLSLFPNRKSEGMSDRLDVCAISFSPSADRLSVWIYAAESTEAGPNPHAEPIAGPIPYEEFVNQTERKKQSVIYTAGFVLMAVGSILTLLQVVAGGS